MSDIRFNRWLHQSGTGGVYQDGSGRVGIGSSTPAATLEVAGNAEFSNSIGVNTTSVSAASLTGIGNSFQGIYISNGMIIMDNSLDGNHYIGTNKSGLMPGPVTVNGALTIDGLWVVV